MERYLTNLGDGKWKIPGNCANPFAADYEPELDESKLLSYNSRMAFDPTVPPVDESAFKECDWKQFYGDVTEAIPTNAPPPRGTGVSLQMYIDSDHAGEKKARWSRSGFFVFINSALIQWLSTKQATIENSVSSGIPP